MIRMQFYDTYAPGKMSAPYDCSKQHAGSSGNLTKYCLQARFYSCATMLNCPVPGLPGSCDPAAQARLANFLPCAENQGGGGLSKFEDAAPCAKKWGLDVDAIEKCAAAGSKEPMEVIDIITKETNAAKPEVKFFPDVRVAGKMIDATATALVKAVCAEYKGSKPAACH